MSRELLAGGFLILGTLWGSSFVAINIGLPYFPPLQFAALRFLIAGIVILGYALYTTSHWYPSTRTEWMLTGIAGTVLIGGHHAFLYLGQQYVSGAVAAIVVSLGPILTALFAVMILDDRLTVLDVVGFILGILGVFLVAQPGIPEGSNLPVFTRILALEPQALLRGDSIGIMLVFLGAVCFALGAVLTRTIKTELPMRTVQAWAMLTGSILLFASGSIRGESLAMIHWTPIASISLLYLGIITGAGAFLIYFELLDRLGATKINLIGYLEPVSATLLSWIILGHLIDPLTGLGFAAIIGGFICVQRHSFISLFTNKILPSLN